MVLVIAGSVAFSVGGAFMKASNGCTRLGPTLVVAMSFMVGAVLLTRAVHSANVSTTIVFGLGVEAIASVVVGLMFLGERLSLNQGVGVVTVMAGVVLLQR